MARYGLTLQRSEVVNANFRLLSAFRLRIEVTQACGLDSRIFVYRREPINAYTSEIIDTFFTIASPVDMSEYPPEEPDPVKAPPFFRKNFVELDFRSTAIAEEAWLLINHEARILCEALARLDQLKVTQTIQIGDDCEPSSESAPT